MKRIFLTIIILLSGCTEDKDAYYINNTVLFDLGTLTEVAQYLYRNPPADEEITRKIESMIYSKIFIAKNAEIKITQLQIESVNGLCKTIVLSQNKHFGVSINDEDVTNMIKTYLKQIQTELKTVSDKFKATVLNDANCAI